MSKILHSSSRSPAAPMLFSALPPLVRRQLREQSPSRHFNAGQIIQQRGDKPDGFWLIESGSISVGRFLQSGDFRGVALLGPGDSWGELALFAGRPRVVDAIARSDSELRHIRARPFESALNADPAAMRLLLGALSRQLQETLDVVAGIRRGSATARVAGTLANLAEGGSLPARIEISQQELAELLGLTRATVNTALRELEKQALVRRSYGAVHVLNRERLAETGLD